MELIKSDSLLLRGVVDTQQGGRPENQDDYGAAETPLGFLFIVCDGMGGGPAGKTASYMVKYEIINALKGCNQQTPCDKAFRMAVGIAHETLLRKMEEMPALIGMGSTFVAVLISGHSAFIAHAGDSRCYHIRGKRLLYCTQDHSLVGELVRKKALTEEQARTSPQSNIITRGLGSVSNNTPDIVEVPYKKGDKFILCTDGVWGIMPHKELMKRFTVKVDNKIILNDLSVEIDRIGNRNGGYHDNHTMGIIEMDCSSSLKDSCLSLLKGVNFQLPPLFKIDSLSGGNVSFLKYILIVVVTLIVLLFAYLGLSKLFGKNDGGNDSTSAIVKSDKIAENKGTKDKQAEDLSSRIVKMFCSIFDFANSDVDSLIEESEDVKLASDSGTNVSSNVPSDFQTAKQNLFSLVNELDSILEMHEKYELKIGRDGKDAAEKKFKEQYSIFEEKEKKIIASIESILNLCDDDKIKKSFQELKSYINNVIENMYSYYQQQDNKFSAAHKLKNIYINNAKVKCISFKAAISLINLNINEK